MVKFCSQYCEHTDGLLYPPEDDDIARVKCNISGQFLNCGYRCVYEKVEEIPLVESMNLVPAIKEIEKVIKDKKREFDKQIKPYMESLEQLRKINTACEECNGTGKILRSRACAEDDRPDPNDPSDYITCKLCGGSGKA